METETRLYVGNLSEDVSVDALRKRFETCGAVSNVELAVDRSSGRMRGYALITMATAADARSAKSQLNGVMFDERPLRVNEAEGERTGSRPKAGATKALVRITSQFRERHNMTYELDCNGVLLALRVFPADAEEKEWRIEARTKNVPGVEEIMVAGTAPTRAAALEGVIQSWCEQTTSAGLSTLDWTAITEAMLGVRAI